MFTASEKDYANPIIDLLDPENWLIAARFYRNSCFNYNGAYVKDLIIFNKPLNDIVIVYNSMAAFRFQIDNGVSIADLYDDLDDDELVHLMCYFPKLAAADDVRKLIEFHFHFRIYSARSMNELKMFKKVKKLRTQVFQKGDDQEADENLAIDIVVGHQKQRR